MNPRWTLTCLIWLLWSSAELPADETIHGLVRVAASGATVRSGPGNQYYACLRLAAGSRVDVLLQHPSGFVAIRPPRGSTSWVAADDLHIREARGAEIIRTSAVSWIGSQLKNPQDHHWQIELPVGSRLTVHGQETLQVHSALPAGRYYRVTPPAGEYRWVSQRELIFPANDPVAGSGEVVQAAFQGEAGLASNAIVAGTRGWRNRNSDAPIPLVAGLTRSSTARSSQASIGKQILSLEARLSQAMAASDGKQKLVELGQELSRLSRGTLSDADRQHVTTLIQRSHQFRQLRQERAVMSAARSNSIYDASGYLMKVHAGSRRAPQFAILDADGQVLEFASPAPGLNLHRYLKKEVGVFGYKSYLPELKTPHITVYRVVDLARHRPVRDDRAPSTR